MRNNRGVTLIIVIITVIVLSIMGGLIVTGGIDTYRKTEVVKFESYMKAIQKKVDIIVEENGQDSVKYNNLGTPLTDDQKGKLQEIIDSNSAIKTRNVNEEKLRYFSVSDIEDILEIKDINDSIIINFANRDVISLKGIKKDGTNHFVEYTLK